MVAGSNPAEPTTSDFPDRSELVAEVFQLRELLGRLLGGEGVRKMDLKAKSNEELFYLYGAELELNLNSARAIYEAKRVLRHFQDYLGQRQPSVDLAKGFLGQFTQRKPTTRFRYASVMKCFMHWYGEELNIRVKVPKKLPEYVRSEDIEKLKQAIRDKESHKKKIERELLLVDVAINTGLRRGELADLKVRDIEFEERLLIVRDGKGLKDRSIPLITPIRDRLRSFTRDMARDVRVFGLCPDAVGALITYFSRKAGMKLHTHSLRDNFATTLLERGATIREVQELLGHTNLNNTERYTLLTEKHLRRAVDLLEKDGETVGGDREVDKAGSNWEGLVECLVSRGIIKVDAADEEFMPVVYTKEGKR